MPELINPTYQKVDKSSIRSSFGSILTDLIIKTMATSGAYKLFINAETDSSIIKKFKKFITPKKFADYVTKKDIAGAGGSGSLWTLSCKEVSGYDNTKALKTAMKEKYEKYLDYIEGTSSLSNNSTILTADSDIFILGFFIVFPLVYFSLFASYFLIQATAAGMNTSNFYTNALEKSSLRRLFESLKQNYKNTDAISIDNPEMNKLLRMLVYYLTTHKFNIKE